MTAWLRARHALIVALWCEGIAYQRYAPRSRVVQ